MSRHGMFPEFQRGQQPGAIDRGVIGDLRVVLGEEGSNTLADLVDLFLSDVPNRFREIHQMIGRGQWEGIKPHVEFLRGWCETLGARDAACRCKDMELFMENLAMDPEAGFNQMEFASTLREAEEAFSKAASELVVITAEY